MSRSQNADSSVAAANQLLSSSVLKPEDAYEQELTQFINSVKTLASTVASDLQSDFKDNLLQMMEPATTLLTPRKIWSHDTQGKLVNSNFINKNIQNHNLCISDTTIGICKLLKMLLEGNATHDSLGAINTFLIKTKLQVQSLELAGSDEIRALREGLHMGAETYQQWVQKIKNDPKKYGFNTTEDGRVTAAKAAKAAAAEAATGNAKAAEAAEAATVKAKRKYLKQTGGAGEALESFLNNHNLQYFIMTFFQFLRVNPALSAATPAASAQPVVSSTGRRVSVNNLHGGSIIDTILNTPQTIQHGGSQYDIRRIENILNTPIKLYSNQLRGEVNFLKSKLESSSPNHKMDASSEATLEAMLSAISHLENSVLTATLLGHKFLEAHLEYSNVDDLAKAKTTLEKLQQIAALVEHKSDKLQKKNQQIAQTIQLALHQVSPYGLSLR
jgi:hypothetical protein